MRAISDYLWILCHARRLRRINASGLFDGKHYRAQIDPRGGQYTYTQLLCDYLRRGWRLGHTPGNWLDIPTYQASWRAYEEGLPPETRSRRPRSTLEHYVYVGRKRGLATRPFDAERRVPPPVTPVAGASSIAAVVHVYYPELWPEMAAALRQIGIPFDLFVSLVEGASDHLAETISAAFPKSYVGVFPNHGRDVFPFVHMLNSGALERYEFVLKLHTKKSPHLRSGAAWRRRMISSLVESGRSGRPQALDAMSADPAIGILAPPGTLMGAEAWKACRDRTIALAARAGIPVDDRTFQFVGGTMFWYRPAALEPIRRLALQPGDFEMEAGHLDGTASHALERLFGAACASAGYLIREQRPPDADLPYRDPVPAAAGS